MEIIRHIMYHYRSSNHIFWIKTFRIYRTPSEPGICKQRRQISCMLWMLCLFRIIMRLRILEKVLFISCAACTLMYMKSIKIAIGLIHRIG